jgi:hypothetical protein
MLLTEISDVGLAIYRKFVALFYAQKLIQTH